MAGVKARNGQKVLASAEACARDLGRKQQWDKWARGCSELEFVQIARVRLPFQPDGDLVEIVGTSAHGTD
jgi:hypothetical protein